MNFTDVFWKNLFEVPLLHAKWLNTLSYFENCGAKLLAKCQHPILVSEELLKHAAEEFRHAFYFKSLIPKVYKSFTFSDSYKELLGGYAAHFYLDRLNIRICKLLKKKGRFTRDLKIEAYLLVTYAIEMRALKVYKSYQNALKFFHLKISIQNVLREEQEHLSEIFSELKFSHANLFARESLQIESALFQEFYTGLMSEFELMDYLRNDKKIGFQF